MIDGHGGNIYSLCKELGCRPSRITDMSSNVNPLGPPSGLMEFLKESMDNIKNLPRAGSDDALKSFAGFYGIDPEKALAGNGTTQFIHTIPLALKTKKVLIFGPTYSDYADSCKMHNVNFSFFLSKSSLSFCHDLEKADKKVKNYDLIFICNPNNPTGNFILRDELLPIIKNHPETVFIIDESYLPFADNGENHTFLNINLPNILVLNSMSKIFRVPGLRIGFIAGSKKLINAMKNYLTPWAVNSMAQAAIIYLMEKRDETKNFIKKSRKFLEKERKIFYEKFDACPHIGLFPSAASFILCRLKTGLTSDFVWEKLAKEKILIRDCKNFYGLSEKYIRISLKTSGENRILCEKLLNINKA